MLQHVIHALFRLAWASIDEKASSSVEMESRLVKETNSYIIEFRNYVFSNYNVKNKKVDECVNKALQPIEKNDTAPTDCRHHPLYVKVHDEILDKVRWFLVSDGKVNNFCVYFQFSEENIEKKAREICTSLDDEKPAKVVECAQKAYEQIEKEGYGEDDIKQKFQKVYEESEACMKELKNKYEDGKNELQIKCSWK